MQDHPSEKIQDQPVTKCEQAIGLENSCNSKNVGRLSIISLIDEVKPKAAEHEGTLTREQAKRDGEEMDKSTSVQSNQLRPDATELCQPADHEAVKFKKMERVIFPSQYEQARLSAIERKRALGRERTRRFREKIKRAAILQANQSQPDLANAHQCEESEKNPSLLKSKAERLNASEDQLQAESAHVDPSVDHELSRSREKEREAFRMQYEAARLEASDRNESLERERIGRLKDNRKRLPPASTEPARSKSDKADDRKSLSKA